MTAPVVLGAGGTEVRDAGDGDLVRITRPVRAGPGWIEGLRAAAYSDSTVASAAAIELDGVEDVVGAAKALAAAAAPMRPRLAAGDPACVYVRRSALELAGPLDDGFADRARAAGLLHVVADDVPVVPVSGAPLDPGDPADLSGGEERPANPFERARANARRIVDGLTVTIDARALRYPTAGTQVHLLELIAALARNGGARLRVVVPPAPTADAGQALDAIDGIERLVADDFSPGETRTQVVHRPHQVTSAHDMALLRHVGERVVVTHQDLLLFHNPTYHEDRAAWGDFRRLTAGTLAAADLVLTFSQHAAADLAAEGLAEAHRVRVVPLALPAASTAQAAAMDPLGGRPYLLCVGTDLQHKNRLWALRLLAALRERGWEGGLVLAGSHVPVGGSAAAEATWLATRPELRAAVVDLGPVEDDARTPLYAGASAVVYPTTYEGFGLVPFEAAAAGTPPLWAPQASLAELLPRDAATLVPWAVEASADRVLAVLRDRSAADAIVADVLARADALSWEHTAAGLLAAYEDALRLPPREGAEARWRFLEVEAQRGDAHARYTALRAEVGDTGLALVGEGGLLPPDAQRSLAALAGHRAIRRPLVGALRLLHQAGSRRRR